MVPHPNLGVFRNTYVEDILAEDHDGLAEIEQAVENKVSTK